jgi:hypothetical protein
VGFVVDGAQQGRVLSRYDALLVPHAALEAPARTALARVGSSSTPVLVGRLPADTTTVREAEKAARGVPEKPVVLVDVRDDFSGTIDRVVFQLALKSQEAAVVLLAPHDEHARGRVQKLCEKHAVDAWLASGPDGLTSAAGVVDLVVGRPSWDELMLLAAHRVAVSWLGGEGAPPQPLAAALRSMNTVDDVGGVLQLAAALDRRLADPKSIAARGLALREALVGPERALLDVLGSVEPRAGGALGALSWEPVGPHAARLKGGEATFVEPVDPSGAPREPQTAARIEEQLAMLKARIADEGRA